MYAAAFGVGAACVGAAGALVSPILPFQPTSGLGLSVTSFNIVIIGGMGSLLGAFVGGLLVSIAESLGAVFLSPSLKEIVSFALLILILLFRPAGLFPELQSRYGQLLTHGHWTARLRRSAPAATPSDGPVGTQS